MRACKILSGGEFVTDCYFGFGTTADEGTRSAMLAGAQAVYEHKENTVSKGMHVKC